MPPSPKSWSRRALSRVPMTCASAKIASSGFANTALGRGRPEVPAQLQRAASMAKAVLVRTFMASRFLVMVSSLPSGSEEALRPHRRPPPPRPPPPPPRPPPPPDRLAPLLLRLAAPRLLAERSALGLREPLRALLPDLLVLGLLVDGLDADGFEAEGRDAPPAGCVLGRDAPPGCVPARGAEAPARLPALVPERSKPRAWSFVTRFWPAVPPNCCAVCGLL